MYVVTMSVMIAVTLWVMGEYNQTDRKLFWTLAGLFYFAGVVLEWIVSFHS